MVVLVPGALFAAPVAQRTDSPGFIGWQISGSNYEKVLLTVSTPAGDVISREFKAGTPVGLSMKDLGTADDGVYNYQLTVVPRVPPKVRMQLEKAREAGDDAGARAIMRSAGIAEAAVEAGAFSVLNGAIVSGNIPEPTLGLNTARPVTPVPNDQVIPDDLIVQGSLCVGLDCVNNESFGFDTIRIKENNTRIKFEDTSVGSFPSNDWQLTANDSASGGSSKFSIEDITGSRVPFTITAGATTNSIFVDSTGRVGFRTSTPVLDLHVATSNTPAIRLEQNNTGGFTAQTWDIGANEANFFVRDVTGGSLLPFRIRPGAPTSSVDISADGDVGVGTASPNANTRADFNDSTQLKARIAFTGQEYFQSGNSSTDGLALVLGVNRTGDRQLWLTDTNGLGTQSASQGVIRFRPNDGDISAISTSAAAKNLVLQANAGSANVGIGCTTPTFDLMIGSGSGCVAPTSGINAGSVSFTTSSSREIKENLDLVTDDNILDKIEKIGVYKYDFIGGPTDKLGLMAEDFHTIFERGSNKLIDGQDISMALWLAVQELTAQNKDLKDRLSKLEEKQQ